MAPTWTQTLVTLLSITSFASAYRPVQHCKQLGDNGHYSACMSFAQHYNETSQQTDLFVRYNWYKYLSSKNGWHAFGLGERMAGAMMFIMYGDPTSESGEMTLSVRSAEGQKPPRPILEIDQFQSPKAKGHIPEVDVKKSSFEPYTGPFTHSEHGKPSHVGVAEFIVRGHSLWIGTRVSNTSAEQRMIWSSNYRQDFNGDFSSGVGLEMHEFGRGFGFVWVDLLHSTTPVPIFGQINEMQGNRGLSEVSAPAAPTPEELGKGDFVIANSHLGGGASEISQDKEADDHNPFNDHNTTPSTVPEDANQNKGDKHDDDHDDDDHSHAAQSEIDKQLDRTVKGKTIRDWLWHLHGLLLTMAFFFLFPLGTYFIRAPRPTAFNLHWTIQALGTLATIVGCMIGWIMSHAIHRIHQYIGIFIAIALLTQLVLGWRHHVNYIATKQRTWISVAHVNLGRVILPLGFANIIFGMNMRQYGWFTMVLVYIVIAVETVLLAIYLWKSNTRGRATVTGLSELKDSMRTTGPPRGEDAEEYFQLAGEDEFSDSDGEDLPVADGAARTRQQEKRDENARLAKLDRV